MKGIHSLLTPTILLLALPLTAQREKVIEGYIRNSNGQPFSAATIRVEAFDRDGAINGDHDFMGSALTDAAGYYRIGFYQVGWDGPKTNHHTLWRPDIFLKVLTHPGNGQLHVSATHEDWPLRESPLRIDVTIPPAASATGFQPAQHGFHFANSFLYRGFSFGLCGGMCWEALHRYHASVAIPPSTTTPPQGSQLYDLLFARQIQILLHNHEPGKVAAWQIMPNSDWRVSGRTLARGIGYHTKLEIEKIRATLAAGRPQLLMLVRESGLSPPWGNHIVLAYGYRTIPTGLELRVYDPNCPDAGEVWIRVDTPANVTNPIQADHYRLEWNGTALVRTQSWPLRGLYALAGPIPSGSGAEVQRFAASDMDSRSRAARGMFGAEFRGDFDGDGFSDYMFADNFRSQASLRRSDGQRLTMTETATVSWPSFRERTMTWTGRFHSHNADSVLVYTPDSGDWRLFWANPQTYAIDSAYVGSTAVDDDLTLAGEQMLLGDYDGDGYDNILLHRPADHSWHMATLVGQTMSWQPLGFSSPTELFNHALFHVGRFASPMVRQQVLIHTGGNWLLLSVGTSGTLQVTSIQGNSAQFGDLMRDEVSMFTGDYDGDGIDDVVIYDRASHQWHLGRMLQLALRWSLVATTPGLGPLHNENSLLSVGDFDGNGSMDFAAFRFSDQSWHIGVMSGGALSFSQIHASPGLDPDTDDMILSVDRSINRGRDSIGFHEVTTDTYWMFTLSGNSFTETHLLDVGKIGGACPNAAGSTPRQWTSQQPLAGGNLTMTLENAAPNALAVHVLGFSETSWNGLPLPLSLSPLGGPAWCTLQVDPLSYSFLFTGPEGNARVSRATSAVMLGHAVRSQFAVFDPTMAQALPVVVSEGLRFRFYL